VPSASTVALLGVMETATAATLTVDEPDFDVSSREVAVMVTLRSIPGLAGALYVTDMLVTLLSVPAPDGERVQVTPWLDGSLLVAAVTGTVPPACTVEVARLTETEIAPTVMAAELAFEA